MREQIIEFFKDIYPESYHLEDGAFILGFKGEELSEYFSIIEELTEEGYLVSNDGVYFQYHTVNVIPVQSSTRKTYIGTYRGSQKGYGFVIPQDEKEPLVFIPPTMAQTAMHQDVVEYEMTKAPTKEKKGEGRIIRILERHNTRIVGTIDRQKYAAFVTPVQDRLQGDIYIPLPKTMDARSGSKVVVQITAWPEHNKKAEGEVVYIVGDSTTPDLDVLTVMATYDLPREFPKAVQEEAQRISFHISDDTNRLDLRHIPMITIDGEDAKDLDDAVHATYLDNGNIELGVHIADVSHYVPYDSIIDKEAYERGTSVYLVDRVIPMLPVELSNGICSLNAKEDRYAMSCIMEVSPQGKVLSYRISPSIIHVNRRCSYREIYNALAHDSIPHDLEPLMDMVRTLETLAYQLIRMRERAGAISFDLPEYKVLLDDSGKSLSIVKRTRTIAERLIEQCMLLANETVATFLSEKLEHSLFRIHEAPSREKIETFLSVLNHSGYAVRLKEEFTSKDIEHILSSLGGKEIEPVAQVLALRSMQQAKYSEINVGHFGLASSMYTHFTSPIRRYPDLIVHRLIRYVLGDKSKAMAATASLSYLHKSGIHCSEREQIATEAERDTLELKKVEYMADYVGEVFTGHISSITDFGLFIELENGVNGLLPFNLLHDDHYIFDELHYVAVGRRTGKEYRLGMQVDVTLVKADVEKRQIDFIMGDTQYSGDYLARLARLSDRPHRKKSKKISKRKEKGSKKNKFSSYASKSTKVSTSVQNDAYIEKILSEVLRKKDKKKKERKEKKVFYETFKGKTNSKKVSRKGAHHGKRK